MSELSDEASESEQLGVSLSLWLGESPVSAEELDVPLDLHTACSIGQYDVVAECIQRREVDLNRKNAGGWTPLMYASYIGHDNIANLLLEVGVNVNATTAKGQTPLMLAASCGNESIAYFLLHQGAELEVKDRRGWTALFHCTSAGHQQMVKFLLDNNADANVREPGSGFTPLMEAAASGHEIIVQYLLDHKVKADERNAKGETARALAMLYGYTKIASLIDSRCPRNKAGLFQDLSSSEDSDSAPPRPRASRSGRAKGASIHDGPQAIAKFRVGAPSEPRAAAAGYATFGGIDERSSDGIRYRDVTSPINELDGQSNSSRDESPFFDHDMPTMRSSSSSEGLPHLMGWEGSVESNEDSDQGQKSSSRRVTKTHHAKGKSRHAGNDALHGADVAASYNGPKDLAEFLEQLGFSKYLPLLEEQDIDLRIFLTLTENDLKEIGITLFGPKRKMTSAIARWHSSARPPSDALEQSYADQLEAEMQEMAIQLHKQIHTPHGVNATAQALDLVHSPRPRLWSASALRGSGGPAESGVAREGAARRDGGMPDGGQDGLEEGARPAGGEPPADAGHERHLGPGPSVSLGTARLVEWHQNCRLCDKLRRIRACEETRRVRRGTGRYFTNRASESEAAERSGKSGGQLGKALIFAVASAVTTAGEMTTRNDVNGDQARRRAHLNGSELATCGLMPEGLQDKQARGRGGGGDKRDPHMPVLVGVLLHGGPRAQML